MTFPRMRRTRITVCQMSKMIQIRNVPDDIHRRLKVKAAESGISLSELMLREARRAAELPSNAEIRRRLEALPPVRFTESAADLIREDRDSR